MTPSDKLRELQTKIMTELDNVSFDEYFEPIPDIIRDRTRDGYGITEDNGAKRNLKKLAKSTIIRRELLDRQGKLSSETTPFTSNLTQSGQMLDSITLKKISGKRYNVVFNEDRDDGETNAQLKRWNEKKGRVFFGLTKAERRTLERNVQKKINELVKRLFSQK